MKAKTTKIALLLLATLAFFALIPSGAMRRMWLPVLAAPLPQVAQQVAFDRDIRPILAARCLGCHGEKTQNGGLRLDAKAFAMQGGQNGPVIVAGKALESRLYQRVSAPNDDERMPPAGERLTAAEVGLLKSATRRLASNSSVPTR